MQIISSGFNDIVCFSHLRWDFVFQRPQHLLERFAKIYRVFYIEEPMFFDEADKLVINNPSKNIWIIVPYLTHAASQEDIIARQKKLLTDFFNQNKIDNYIFWYYTPMALALSDHFHPRLIVYDCMDELSAFKFAPSDLKEKEQALFQQADIVFTGGYSLYEAKKDLHPNIYPFPSSIDKSHFLKARSFLKDPDDQENIPHPRFGFFGVLDERFDLNLIEKVSVKKPEWHFVIVGPVVKINPESLPKHNNIHYLGGKLYVDLPGYIAGWDIAIIPFAKNESTKFISPTKTPEYLAAGKPVISTSIKDVVSPYEDEGLVHIADTPEEFIKCAEIELSTGSHDKWLQNVDEFLLDNSWDNTFGAMLNIIKKELKQKTNEKLNNKEKIYV